jgi:hypothetical protein
MAALTKYRAGEMSVGQTFFGKKSWSRLFLVFFNERIVPKSNVIHLQQDAKSFYQQELNFFK